VGNDIELQRTNRAENQVIAVDRAEELGCAFFGQLLQAFLQLLHFHRVANLRAAKMFRCEAGDAGELQVFAFAEGVAQHHGAVVRDAQDVAGPGFVRGVAVLRHEGDGVVDGQRLAGGALL
jgi:hypothetical protein